MAATKFGKLSGVAALAIALAGLATPVLAQEEGELGGRGNREAREAAGNIGGGGGERQERPAWRGGREAAPQGDGGRSSRRAEAPRAAPEAAAAPAAAPAQARGWRGGDSGGRGDGARAEGRRWGSQGAPAGTYGRDWSTGRVERPAPAQAAAAAEPAAPVRGRDGRRDGGWSGRERGSGEASRGTTYRDAGRDRRDDGRRDGSAWRGRDDDRRDGSTWSGRSGSRDGYRDGTRRDGSVWQGGSGDRRSGYRSGDGRRWDHHGRRWDRDWRRDRRYDWNSYRRYNRNVFNLGIYYSPYRNYSYRRLSIGYFLDSLFYSNRYWIQDPWQYRLPEVYGPYRWVRYYDDALLVDIYSGEVVDVIHNFFW